MRAVLLCALGVCLAFPAWADRRAGTPGMIQTPSGVKYAEMRPGHGPLPQPGQGVAILYRAWVFKDGQRGQIFDRRDNKKKPYVFIPGQGQAINGLDEGIAQMKVGGKRAVIIPAELAYGAEGVKERDPRTGEDRIIVPPDSPLLFELELVGIR